MRLTSQPSFTSSSVFPYKVAAATELILRNIISALSDIISASSSHTFSTYQINNSYTLYGHVFSFRQPLLPRHAAIEVPRD